MRSWATTFAFTCVLAIGPIHADDDVREQKPEDVDLAAVQGLWERDLKDDRGETVGRATKLIEGRTETITYYDNSGKLLQAHRVKITLRRDGGVRLFEHSEIEIIAGPRKGLKSDRGGGYLYKVQDDKFFEIQGALIRDEQEPLGILVWNKKEAKEA